jgi:hypothetical protein
MSASAGQNECQLFQPPAFETFAAGDPWVLERFRIPPCLLSAMFDIHPLCAAVGNVEPSFDKRKVSGAAAVIRLRFELNEGGDTDGHCSGRPQVPFRARSASNENARLKEMPADYFVSVGRAALRKRV